MIKKCMLLCAELICPDNELAFHTISQSRNTMLRFDDVARDLDIAIDESTEITDIAQIADIINGTQQLQTMFFILGESLCSLCVDWKQADYGYQWITSKDMQENRGRNKVVRATTTEFEVGFL
ncbi:hypothetical protein RF11_02602 [Thelohanellus kitauei]|uniref:Uncharacterized protein n=1 Tax=Thelohanellus kitauei TaxID=669202 RepID=A0A0C2MIS2_THEKT|nr:hypothetical protein RF11_02602 [Thelohanellus kitauei]